MSVGEHTGSISSTTHSLALAELLIADYSSTNQKVRIIPRAIFGPFHGSQVALTFQKAEALIFGAPKVQRLCPATSSAASMNHAIGQCGYRDCEGLMDLDHSVLNRRCYLSSACLREIHSPPSSVWPC